MNVSDLQSLIYSAAGTNAAGNVVSTSAVKSTTMTDASVGQSVNAFSQALGEEIDKLKEAYKDQAVNENDEASQIAEFKKLVSALDGSVLGNITANATDSDLIALSKDLLGTGGGREVLAKLMDGHFNSIVMNDSEDEDKDDDVLNNQIDSFNQTVSETQALLDSLEKVSSNLQK